MDIKYPDYPCVALAAQTKMRKQIDRGDTFETVEGEEIMFFPISGLDDMSHIDQCRDMKGYAVVGFANLDQIVARAPYKAKEVSQLHKRLKQLALPPEMRRAVKAAEESAEVEAPVVAPQAPAVGKSKKKSAAE